MNILRKRLFGFTNKPNITNAMNCMLYSSVSNKTQVKEVIKTIDDMPGPKKLPIVGSLFELKQLGGDIDFSNMIELSRKLQPKYGDLVSLKIANLQLVFVYDPEMFKKVFRNEGDTPIRKNIDPIGKYLKCKGVEATMVNGNGELWRKIRTASNPVAACPKTVHMFLSKQNEIVDDLIRLIDEKIDRKSQSVIVKGFEAYLKNIALELVSVISFDQRIKCVDERTRSPGAAKVMELFDELLTTIMRLLFTVLPYGPYFPTKTWRRFAEISEVMLNFTKPFVEKANEELKTKSKEYREDLKSRTILQQYLLTMGKYELDMNVIIANMTEFLLGAIDTVPTVLHYTLVELGRNQDVQERLYDEIKNNCTDGVLTEDKLEKMQYLKAVVKESLRFNPPVSGINRYLQSDLVLGNYLVPKGTLVFLEASFTAKSDRYFRKPNEFDPSRWLKSDDGSKNESSHPYAFLPFGFGARQCIGRRIAEQEIYLLLTKLIYNYKIEYVGEKFGIRARLVFSPDKPLDVKLTKRII